VPTGRGRGRGGGIPGAGGLIGLRISPSGTRVVLLFIGPPGRIIAAPYAVVGDSFRADTPQVWSPRSVQGITFNSSTGGRLQSAYDLHPVGKRIATSAAPEQASVQNPIVFVSNFGDDLRTIAPGNK
jgi:hypothetical protein